jgi:hypothetical protein
MAQLGHIQLLQRERMLGIVDRANQFKYLKPVERIRDILVQVRWTRRLHQGKRQNKVREPGKEPKEVKKSKHGQDVCMHTLLGLADVSNTTGFGLMSSPLFIYSFLLKDGCQSKHGSDRFLGAVRADRSK